MSNYLTSLLFWCFFLCLTTQTPDSFSQTNSTKVVEEREFSNDIKDKYSGKDFQYTEEKERVKKQSSSNGFLNFLVFFMSKIFPFVLGGFVIYLLLRLVLGLDMQFWKKTTKPKKIAESLVYKDEDIHETDIEALLSKALTNKEYRLAIRYYYLLILKGLSHKKVIDYHKDKTNSEYLFEIKSNDLRDQFSHLSYIYAYVWYGEFPIDENGFLQAKNKYQSFLNQLK